MAERQELGPAQPDTFVPTAGLASWQVSGTGQRSTYNRNWGGKGLWLQPPFFAKAQSPAVTRPEIP